MNSYQLGEAFGYLTHSEIDLIKRICDYLPDKPIVVNVGAGAGTTSLAVFESREDSLITTVDFRQESPYGSLNGERHAFEKMGYPPPKQILGNSRQIARSWGERNIDLLIIDDGHLENEIAGDLYYWLPWVRYGGYVIFDDYGSNNWPSVKILVDLTFRTEDMVESVDILAVFQHPGIDRLPNYESLKQLCTD